MKSGYTHVSYLIDRSGSMTSIAKDVIGGFNSFIKEQKNVPGKLTLSFSQFDNEYDILYDFSDIAEVKDIDSRTYVPRGSTALLDSIVKLINETGKKLADMKEEDRPEKVLFIIHTDGEENSSQEYRNAYSKIAEIIEHQEKKYNWQFTYIGANQDAIKVGQSLGISKGVNFSATSTGTAAVYNSLNKSVASYRSAVGASATFDFNDQQIKQAEQDILDDKNKKPNKLVKKPTSK